MAAILSSYNSRVIDPLPRWWLNRLIDASIVYIYTIDVIFLIGVQHERQCYRSTKINRVRNHRFGNVFGYHLFNTKHFFQSWRTATFPIQTTFSKAGGRDVLGLSYIVGSRVEYRVLANLLLTLRGIVSTSILQNSMDTILSSHRWSFKIVRSGSYEPMSQVRRSQVLRGIFATHGLPLYIASLDRRSHLKNVTSS